MATQWKTSAADAQAMAKDWYALAPDLAQEVTPAQMAQGVQHWQQQIQEAGSNSAFKDFAASIAKQHGPALATQLATNIAAATKATGLPPWTPANGAVNGQLPGTNTKVLLGPSGGLTHGGSTGNPTLDGALKVAAEVAAGAVTGGAAAPFVGAAVGGLDSAVTPGSNFGNIVTSAATGAAAGGMGGKLNPSGIGSGPIPVSGTTPITMSNVGNASVSGDTSGLPSTSAPGPLSALPAAAAAAAAKAASSDGGSSQPGTPPSNPLSIQSLLSGGLPTALIAGAEGLNAANLQNQSTNYAKDALGTQQALFDSQAPLRAAGIAGMLNPSTPLPGQQNIQALQTIAARGNPFAAPVPVTPPTATPPVSPSTPVHA